MSSQDIESIRVLARTLAQRVKQDAYFADMITKDPVTVLTKAGIPENYIPEFLERTHLSEVQGYMVPSCGLTIIA